MCVTSFALKMWTWSESVVRVFEFFGIVEKVVIEKNEDYPQDIAHMLTVISVSFISHVLAIISVSFMLAELLMLLYDYYILVV